MKSSHCWAAQYLDCNVYKLTLMRVPVMGLSQGTQPHPLAFWPQVGRRLQEQLDHGGSEPQLGPRKQEIRKSFQTKIQEERERDAE